MAKLTIGDKTVTVDDNFRNLPPEQQQATVEEIAAALGIGATPEPGFLSQAAGAADAFVRNAADMATLGNMDKIAAWLGSKTGIGGESGDFEGNLAMQRREDAEAVKEHPIASFSGSVAGGLALPVARVARGAGLVPQSVNAAATGAAIGGAYNVGKQLDGYTPEDIAKIDLAKVGEGALYGGVVGAAVPSFIKGGQMAFNAGRTQYQRAFAPRDLGETKVMNALERDNLVPEDIAARLQGSASPETVAADVGGENTRRLLKSASMTPGPGRERAVTLLEERAAGQPARVSQAIADDLADGTVYYEKLDKLTSDLRTKAKPYYDAAYRTPLDAKAQIALEELLPRIPGEAIRKANNLMKLEGVESKQILARIADDGSVTFERIPDVRQWDYIQRALGEIAEGTKGNGGAGGMTDTGRAVNNLRQAALDILDKQAPAFAKARSIYKGDLDLKKALEAGRKFVRGDVELTQRALVKMSPAEREMFKAGVARQMMEEVLNSPDGANVIRKIWNEARRQKIGAIFGSDSLAKFARRMDEELQSIKTKRTALGGSETAQNLADMADGNAGTLLSAAGDALSGNFKGAVQKTGHAVFNRGLGGMNPKVADRVTQILLEKNPEALQRALAIRSQKAAQNSRRLGLFTEQLVKGAATERERLQARPQSARLGTLSPAK